MACWTICELQYMKEDFKLKRFPRIILMVITLTLLLTVPAFAGEWSVISSRVIDFGSSTDNNNLNAVYAAEFADGTVLSPGETFSYNKVVGARTIARGFAVGQNSIGAPDVGGGVCRESTVLFQTARAAGMDIIERWDHTPSVKYAAPGDDAAVQYGLYDMQFSNSTHVPVMIHTRGDQDENGLHLWAVLLKEETLPSVKVSVTDTVYMKGKLFNGKTFVFANKLAGIYGKQLNQVEKLGFYSISIGGLVFSEANGDVLRSTNGFYVPLRKWTDSFGGIIQWTPGKSYEVALSLPATLAVNIKSGSTVR